MGYPLVPGYELVGRVVDAGAEARARIGEWVFVPGANCYEDARGLFGGAARRVILPAARALPIDAALGRDGILLALAATAYHAIAAGRAPELIVGHGVLGRLLARIALAPGAPRRRSGRTNPARPAARPVTGHRCRRATTAATMARSATSAAQATCSTR